MNRRLHPALRGAAILLPALAALSCGGSSNPVRPTVPDNPIPLAVGNAWHYQEGFSDSVAALETHDDGHDWYRITGNFLGQDLVRMNSLNQFVVLFADATPPTQGVLFDFATPVKSSWTFTTGVDFKPIVITLQSKDDVIDTPAGTFTGCYTFYIDYPGQVGDDLTYVVAPDVGIVYRSDQNGATSGLVDYHVK